LAPRRGSYRLAKSWQPQAEWAAMGPWRRSRGGRRPGGTHGPALFASKLKLEGSFKDCAYLFLPMLVDGSHGVGLEVDEADIHAVPENRSYDNAGFNGQRRGVPLEIQVRRPELRVSLVVVCWTRSTAFQATSAHLLGTGVSAVGALPVSRASGNKQSKLETCS
jgi:hypothetical protein